MKIALDWIVAFAGMAALDAAWAFYTVALVRSKHHLSGVTAAIIFILSALIVRMYVDDGWVIIPAALGAYVGTRIGSEINAIR